MAGRIYLKNSTGGRIVTSGGDDIYLRDLTVRYLDLIKAFTARAPRYLDLNALIYGRVTRYLELGQDLDAFVKSGYDLFARNLSTGAVTSLGFIEATAAPLELTGVALADGFYEIEIRLRGYYWQDMRCITRFPVQISGGEVVVPLPAISQFAYRYQQTDTLLSWAWVEQPGTATPADFAIWTSAVSPVNTAGAPTHIVNTPQPLIPDFYSQAIVQGAAIIYAAICARSGASRGPLIEMEIPAPPVTLASPPNQISDFTR